MRTLEQLIQKLRLEIQDKGIENALELLSLFKNYIGTDWKTYFQENKNEFQCSTLHKDEHLKLVLIYWNGFRKSEKHGHAEGGGLMKVLSGKLAEIRFDPEEEKILGRYEYETGDLSYIHDALAHHIVENPEKEPAISLHLYCFGKPVSNNGSTKMHLRENIMSRAA